MLINILYLDILTILIQKLVSQYTFCRSNANIGFIIVFNYYLIVYRDLSRQKIAHIAAEAFVGLRSLAIL